MIKPSAARVIAVLAGTAAYLGLAILGEGGFAVYFADPALIALAFVFIAMSAAAVFVGGNLSPGEREDRGNRWVIAALSLLGLIAAYVPAWSDRAGIWVMDGEGLRWFGVALTVVGGALRLWPVYVLGDRFSGLVAIQPGHALVTSGIYSRIRHPSYLGLLLASLGWGLAFRAGLGVLLTTLMIVPVIARIGAEEALLAAQFGAQYTADRARTARLLPGIY